MSASRSGAPNYRRVPGRRGFLIAHRLYAAEDHLLAVHIAFFSERYRRLFFRDIQAIWLHWTDRWIWVSIIHGFLAALCGVLVAATWPTYGESGTLAAAWGIAGVVFFAAMIWNLALGKSCRCFVRTAVQTVELPSLNRVRRARTFRTDLIEKVKLAQGGATTAPPIPGAPPIERGTGADVAIEHASAASAPAPRAAPSPTPEKRRAALNSLLACGFAAALAAAGLLFDWFEPRAAGFVATLAGVLIAIVGGVVHLVLARGAGLGRSAFLAGLSAPIITLVGAVAAYVAFFVILLDEPELMIREAQSDPFLAVAGSQPGEYAVVDSCYIGGAIAYLAAAVWAIAIWGAARRAFRRETAAVAAAI